MTEHDVLEDAVQNLDKAPDNSVIGRLKKRRQEVAANKTKNLDITGYDGELFCKYRLLSGDEVQEITRRSTDTDMPRSEKILAIVCDNLIAACEEFWTRDKDTGEEKPVRQLLEDPIHTPVRYDTDLARFLEFYDELPEPRNDARQVVLALFGGNDIAVQGHAGQLMRWMVGGNEQTDRDMGELMDLLR